MLQCWTLQKPKGPLKKCRHICSKEDCCKFHMLQFTCLWRLWHDCMWFSSDRVVPWFQAPCIIRWPIIIYTFWQPTVRAGGRHSKVLELAVISDNMLSGWFSDSTDHWFICTCAIIRHMHGNRLILVHIEKIIKNLSHSIGLKDDNSL